MNLYTTEQLAQINEHKFAFVEWALSDHLLSMTLNRAHKKNALHPQMVKEIAYLMQYAHDTAEVWMVTIRAKGNVFCAGADLKAMIGVIEPNDSTIPDASTKDILIGELFNKVYKPVISVVTGDVYAGGFFFLAGSTIVVAQEDVKFGLPEVKRGLYPFQVMAALLKVMPARRVIDWCIRGYNLPVTKAQEYGLVTEACPADEIDEVVDRIVAELKQNSPSAIRLGLQAYDHILPAGEEHQYLYDMLQQTIGSADGQEGLTAFREKRKPEWKGF